MSNFNKLTTTSKIAFIAGFMGSSNEKKVNDILDLGGNLEAEVESIKQFLLMYATAKINIAKEQNNPELLEQGKLYLSVLEKFKKFIDEEKAIFLYHENISRNNTSVIEQNCLNISNSPGITNAFSHYTDQLIIDNNGGNAQHKLLKKYIQNLRSFPAGQNTALPLDANKLHSNASLKKKDVEVRFNSNVQVINFRFNPDENRRLRKKAREGKNPIEKLREESPMETQLYVATSLKQRLENHLREKLTEVNKKYDNIQAKLDKNKYGLGLFREGKVQKQSIIKRTISTLALLQKELSQDNDEATKTCRYMTDMFLAFSHNRAMKAQLIALHNIKDALGLHDCFPEIEGVPTQHFSLEKLILIEEYLSDTSSILELLEVLPRTEKLREKILFDEDYKADFEAGNFSCSVRQSDNTHYKLQFEFAKYRIGTVITLDIEEFKQVMSIVENALQNPCKRKTKLSPGT